jgi:cell division transport system permease protein
LLSGPVNQLATLYQSEYRLASLDLDTSLILLGSSVLLGLAGAWLAVGRHLSAIEPD